MMKLSYAQSLIFRFEFLDLIVARPKLLDAENGFRPIAFVGL